MMVWLLSRVAAYSIAPLPFGTYSSEPKVKRHIK
jgi:hypothetical protein